MTTNASILATGNWKSKSEEDDSNAGCAAMKILTNMLDKVAQSDRLELNVINQNCLEIETKLLF